MPLYTYIMTYDGKTKAHQTRRSNYTGWIGQVVGEAFPQLGKREPGLIAALMSVRPRPVVSAQHVWQISCKGAASEFILHVVETRG